MLHRITVPLARRPWGRNRSLNYCLLKISYSEKHEYHHHNGSYVYHGCPRGLSTVGLRLAHRVDCCFSTAFSVYPVKLFKKYTLGEYRLRTHTYGYWPFYRFKCSQNEIYVFCCLTLTCLQTYSFRAAVQCNILHCNLISTFSKTHWLRSHLIYLCTRNVSTRHRHYTHRL